MVALRVHLAPTAALLVGLTAFACGENNTLPTSPDLGPQSDTEQGCARTSVGLTPLTDMAGGRYQGQPGGLYPGGNAMPAGHLAAGLAIVSAIGPLDAAGQPDAGGRYALISIGMSNTTQEFRAFMDRAEQDSAKHPQLVLVDGAQGGQTAADWSNPGCACWSAAESRVRQAGLSNQQVVAAWVKLANRQPSGPWPAATERLQQDTSVVLRNLKARFPNLRIAYLSSRIYAGYATTPLNPEPYAYESAFAARWVIEDQLNGGLPFDGPAAAVPWLAWGPYFWADGLRPRGDGLTWACSDFAADGTHPSGAGRAKVAQQLLDFMHSDPTARVLYQ